MAINKNPTRNALHTAICMITGAGKGIALNELDIIPAHHPVVIFDKHWEHDKIAGRKVYSYHTKLNFAKQFEKAWRSGKPFAMAYRPKLTGKNEEESLKQLQAAAEWFAKLVWNAADGNRVLYPVFEEYSAYSQGTSDDNTTIGKIWKEGRGFGLRGIAIFQRSATVPKTIWGNSPIKVIGAQGSENDIDRITKELSCSRDEVIDLGWRNKQLEMYLKKFDEMVRTQVHYLVSHSFGTYQKKKVYVRQAKELRKKWTKDQKIIAKGGEYELVA